jgi:hypothetical protein
MTNKVWFITGASRGFGMVWTCAALGRGDKVAATVRNIGAPAELERQYRERLLPLTRDVTERVGDLAAIKDPHDHFARLDVVVNNAGYGQFGCIEELSEDDVRKVFERGILASAVLAVTTVTAGVLSDRVGHHKTITIRFAVTPAGMLGVYVIAYGPVGAYLRELFRAEYRYTGARLAYNLGGILGRGQRTHHRRFSRSRPRPTGCRHPACRPRHPQPAQHPRNTPPQHQLPTNAHHTPAVIKGPAHPAATICRHSDPSGGIR